MVSNQNSSPSHECRQGQADHRLPRPKRKHGHPWRVPSNASLRKIRQQWTHSEEIQFFWGQAWMDKNRHPVASTEYFRSQASHMSHLQSRKSLLLQWAPSCGRHRMRQILICGASMPKNQLLLEPYSNTTRDGLVWITVLISREAWSVWMAKLSTSSCSPGVKVSVLQDSNSVCLATSDLSYLLQLQDNNEFRFRLIWASIFILGHSRGVGMA